MKTLILVLLAFSLIGCVDAKLDVQQVAIQHSFAAPNDIPGCPANDASYCAAEGVVTVNLPGFTENIHFDPPGGVTGSATIDHVSLTTAAASGFSFLQTVTLEVSASNIATYPLVDFKPSDVSGQTIYLDGNGVNLLPYIEGDATTFTIAITGTVPPQEVSLDVTIFLNGEVSYEKGL